MLPPDLELSPSPNPSQLEADQLDKDLLPHVELCVGKPHP